MTTSTRQRGTRPEARGLRRRALPALVIAVILAVVAGVAYSLENQPWQGAVPDDALVAGQDASGSDLYICVAASWGGEHPGALTADGVCHVPWGGQEYTFSDGFEVVIGSGEWVDGGDGGVPADAYAAGDDGAPIYVCRVDGHPGKLAEDGFCYIAADGVETSHTSGYEVLVQ